MYLDITAEESYKRKSHEKLGEENLDRHESNLDFLNNVRRRYLETEGGNLCDWKKIDATQSIEKVQDEILQTINELRKKQEI
jgi:thymidylate kinase